MPPRPFATERLGRDRASLEASLANELIYTMGKDPITATPRDWFNTTAYTVRQRLIEQHRDQKFNELLEQLKSAAKVEDTDPPDDGANCGH